MKYYAVLASMTLIVTTPAFAVIDPAPATVIADCNDDSTGAKCSHAKAPAASDVRNDTVNGLDNKAQTKGGTPGVGIGTSGPAKNGTPVDVGTTGVSDMTPNSPSANGGITGSASRGR